MPVVCSASTPSELGSELCAVVADTPGASSERWPVDEQTYFVVS